MIDLRHAKGIATHPAPDFDGVMTSALVAYRYPKLYRCPLIFIPAGTLSSQEVEKYERKGIALFDVGGFLTGYDHHGSGKEVSSCRLVARSIGLANKRLEPLLAYIDENDRQGVNYRLKIVKNGREVAADDFLLTSIIRASSQVRYNPFKEDVTHQERVAAFWRLVRLARIVINRVANTDNSRATLSKVAGDLLQLSLCQAIAKQLGVPQPKFIDGFNNTLNFINRTAARQFDEQDEEQGYKCQEDPVFKDLIELMEKFPPELHSYENGKLIKDDSTKRFVINLTILGIAQELVGDALVKPWEKLIILKDGWLSLIARKSDWLLAVSHLKNSGVLKRQDVRGWHVVSVESNCSQIGPASRLLDPEREVNPQKAAVTIAKRSTGHVQITCRPQTGLKRKIKKAGILLREAEVRKQGMEIPREQLLSEGNLVANWYIAESGAVLNGSLTNPLIEPTSLTLEEIHQIVCLALSQE